MTHVATTKEGIRLLFEKNGYKGCSWFTSSEVGGGVSPCQVERWLPLCTPQEREKIKTFSAKEGYGLHAVKG